ncbi:MAG TPA: hypothetical protein VF628_01580 [Allosphingosinicella sp.]|jgi:hypothetical protein
MALFDLGKFLKRRSSAPSASSAANMPREVMFIPSKYGDVEAVNRWGDQWLISYPWETQEFFGSRDSVKAEMTRRIDERYAAEKKVPPTVIYIPTGSGDARATHLSMNRWRIEYPWAVEDFAGNMIGVRKEMKRRIIEHYTARPEAAE